MRFSEHSCLGHNFLPEMDRNLLFYIGEKFDSFEALTSKLEAYCKSAYVHYWTRDSRKIGCARIQRHIDEKLRYYSLKYTCVLGGQAFHSRGTGQRYSFSIRASNCPAHISVRASKDGMHLEVISVNNEHNHDQSQEFFQALPKERRLPDDIKAEVLDLLKLQVDKTRVKEYIRLSTKKVLTTKDLTNIVSASRLENRPEITPERSNELLAKVYNLLEVESGLSCNAAFGVHLSHEKNSLKKRRQSSQSNLLKSLKNNGKIRLKNFTGRSMSDQSFLHIKSETLRRTYELPSGSDISQAYVSEELADTLPVLMTSKSTATDEIIEDPGRFCITCGQTLPDDHKLLQQIMNPSTIFESVNFLSPMDQVGMVEEVVSTIEASCKADCEINVEHCIGSGRSVAVCSSEGVVTVKEEDFEAFVQRSMNP